MDTLGGSFFSYKKMKGIKNKTAMVYKTPEFYCSNFYLFTEDKVKN